MKHSLPAAEVLARAVGRGLFWWRFIHRSAVLASAPDRRRRTVGANCKNLPKIASEKKSWNWLVILVPATVWQILNIKCVWNDGKRKLRESFETCLEKFVKSHQVYLISAGFGHSHRRSPCRCCSQQSRAKPKIGPRPPSLFGAALAGRSAAGRLAQLTSWPWCQTASSSEFERTTSTAERARKCLEALIRK